jgi:hypothetical protein
MRIALKSFLFVGFLFFAFSVDFMDQSSPDPVLIRKAEAFRGRNALRNTSPKPTTPNSPAQPAPIEPNAQQYQQLVTQEAATVPIGTVVQTLPGSCTPVVIGNISYSECGGAFYRAAFQGSNLVFVVV